MTENLEHKKVIGGLSLLAIAAMLVAIAYGIFGQPYYAIGMAFGSGAVFILAVCKSRQMRLAKDESAVSPVIGVILMVAITVVLAAIVFVLVTNLQQPVDDAPRIAFAKEIDGIRIIQSPTGLAWEDITVTGCDTFPVSGNITAGDFITDCVGNVLINHVPTNSVLYSTKFD